MTPAAVRCCRRQGDGSHRGGTSGSGQPRTAVVGFAGRPRNCDGAACAGSIERRPRPPVTRPARAGRRARSTRSAPPLVRPRSPTRPHFRFDNPRRTDQRSRTVDAGSCLPAIPTRRRPDGPHRDRQPTAHNDTESLGDVVPSSTHRRIASAWTLNAGCPRASCQRQCTTHHNPI